ncbi:sorting nexin-27-like isoform X1 [Pecten maximus]|uniref:sorting nexin-27-like isoform X1 n=2 Tax=Pecten maximus TaxID=6579 RepID=UPI001458DEE7|nr:sorting nexin-27-like isoform X1 [Pecten maximus]
MMADSDDSSPPSSPDIRQDDLGPRVVTITKTETGFGFNVRGQVSEGGVLKSINGVLYAPLQHVSAVLEGGAAQRAGIRKGDRILEVNKVNVEGGTHKQVVDLIKSGGDTLTLTVISVPEQVAERLEPSDDSSGPSYIDYSERRSLPISIPDYQTVESNGEKFVVFNIYMAGRHLCSRRYREFDTLHTRIKREFTDFNFPKMPGKKLFQLSEQQLDARRRGLEQYLEKVCAVRVIGESDIMQEFLASPEMDSETPSSEVELKVLLPDRSVCVVTIRRNDTADQVYEAVVVKLNMSDVAAQCFYLFETVEYNFERKLQPLEFPHNIYIQNYSTATATCITMRKWLFTLTRETMLNSDELAVNFLFWEAVDSVNRGQIKTEDKLYELKSLQDSGKRIEYLKTVRHLDGYGEVAFPHCACDSRKDGHVICIIGSECFKLQACKNDGTPESQVIEFQWKDVKSYDMEEEGMTFSFEYDRPGKKPRVVQILTPYYVYMKDCFDKIYEEREWEREETMSAM